VIINLHTDLLFVDFLSELLVVGCWLSVFAQRWRLSVIGYRLSEVGHRLSVFGRRLSTLVSCHSKAGGKHNYVQN